MKYKVRMLRGISNKEAEPQYAVDPARLSNEFWWVKLIKEYYRKTT